VYSECTKFIAWPPDRATNHGHSCWVLSGGALMRGQRTVFWNRIRGLRRRWHRAVARNPAGTVAWLGMNCRASSEMTRSLNTATLKCWRQSGYCLFLVLLLRQSWEGLRILRNVSDTLWLLLLKWRERGCLWLRPITKHDQHSSESTGESHKETHSGYPRAGRHAKLISSDYFRGMFAIIQFGIFPSTL
jgi:hypothetical protein